MLQKAANAANSEKKLLLHGTSKWKPNRRVSKSHNHTIPYLVSMTAADGMPLEFNDCNFDWSMVNIFRTRLCDRLSSVGSCHMIDRCLFSHDVAHIRRTPFLPRSNALTLRYIPVWCQNIPVPDFKGSCTVTGVISWSRNSVAPRAEGGCPRGDNCPFVHSVDEFLYHPAIYKTRSCPSCMHKRQDWGMTMCPWYFCPYAHSQRELRVLHESEAKYPWHLPPQLIDDYYVAHTQGFTQTEMSLIRLYKQNHAEALKRSKLCTEFGVVLAVAEDNPLSKMSPMQQHRELKIDPVLCSMAFVSLLAIRLYPVENYYMPALISFQSGLLMRMLNIRQDKELSSTALINLYNTRDNAKAAHSGALYEDEPTPSEMSETDCYLPLDSEPVVNQIMDLLENDGIMRVMELIENRIQAF